MLDSKSLTSQPGLGYYTSALKNDNYTQQVAQKTDSNSKLPFEFSILNNA